MHKILRAFSNKERDLAKVHLATQVAHMMGRKLEEDDWTKVYCAAKQIPYSGWSNLNIDVNYRGLGVEQKLLRCSQLNGRPIKVVCGTTMMHPAATRSIRIKSFRTSATKVMEEVFLQYAKLIEDRTEAVRRKAPGIDPDMRVGWLLWEDMLTEFLYFEEPWVAPRSEDYYAEWNETPAKGVRKASRSLWIFERDTNKKRFSVTTSAGVKIQPYFDVPPPRDPHLYYFRVQSEVVSPEMIQIWVSASTAKGIRRILGDLDSERVSDAILHAAEFASDVEMNPSKDPGLAEPIQITRQAFVIFQQAWEGVSDEHRAQLFLESLQGLRGNPS